MAKYTQSQMNILIKIIAAVETGGQVYGQARYDDYTPAYANCSNETSCTIGAFQEYGNLAKELLQEILNTYPSTFRKYDNAGIESDLKRTSWTGYNCYSPARGSAKAKAIQAIISSSDGIKVQNSRVQKQMESHIAFAQKQGVSDVDALFMCANFIHQGGQSACTRILKKTQKPYTLDHLYTACKTDTGNQVGAYKTRQQKVYGWLKEKISNKNTSNNNSQGSDNMNKDKAIDALIATAQAEIGYMEKKSNAQLDNKTANVGDGNYTKYWRDLKPSWNGSAWCAVWVSWCMYKTFGLETAKKLLKHENDFPYVYCPTLGARFTKYANPQRGDIVIFYRNGTFAHTGIVTKVEGDKFYTIEGNTNNGSTIIANGGSVCSKSYNNSNLPGTKFCRPDYSIVKSIMNSSSTSKPSTSTYNKWVGAATKDGTDVFANATGTSKLSTYPKLNKGNLVDVIGVSGTRYQVKIADKFVGYVEKSNIKDPNAVVTKPSASTSKTKYPFVGEVTASELNVRTGTGTNYDKLSSYPILKRGNLVDVLKAKKDTSGNKWYQVRIAGKYTGYVSAQYIKKK